MAVFRVRTAREWLRLGVNALRATSEITDVRDGSAAKQMLAAFARVAEMLSVDTARLLELFSIDRAEGIDLDLRAAEYMPDGIARRGATRALGTLRWTRLAGGSDITIPVGTLVRGANGQTYTTTVAAKVPAGATGTQSVRLDEEPGDVPARAEAAGVGGNAILGTVTQQVSVLSGIQAVTNPTPFLGGTDRESDDAYRGRIRARTRSLSRAIPEALVQRALEAEYDGRRVTTASAVRSLTPRAHAVVYIDDGTGAARETADAVAEDLVTAATGGESRFFSSRRPWVGTTPTVTRYPAGGGAAVVLTQGGDFDCAPAEGLIMLTEASFPAGLTAGDRLVLGAYEVFVGLIAAAQRLITGDPTDPTVPSYHGLGVEVRVLTPTVLWLELACSITTVSGANRAAVVAAVRAALSDHANGLQMGEDWVMAEAIERAMRVDGMYDIAFTAPAGNVPVGDAEVARAAAEDIEVS